MTTKREIRGVSYRATVTEESRRVEGYALLFNTDSQPMWGGDLTERIAPTALDGVLEKSDVLCLMNHDERRGVLARWRMGEGSLSLKVDSKGLLYSFDAPATALGDELVESLRRGDIAESSFAFTVERDNWERGEDGRYIRTIVQIDRLYDVSPVYFPAYEDTEVALRSLEGIRERDRAAEERRAKEEIERRQAEQKKELEAYYDNLIKRF